MQKYGIEYPITGNVLIVESKALALREAQEAADLTGEPHPVYPYRNWYRSSNRMIKLVNPSSFYKTAAD